MVLRKAFTVILLLIITGCILEQKEAPSLVVYEVKAGKAYYYPVSSEPSNLHQWKADENKAFEAEGKVMSLEENKAFTSLVFSTIGYLFNGDDWQTSEETLDRGTGDCKDRANLVYILASQEGYSQLHIGVVVFKGPEIAHADFCIFPEGRRSHFFVVSEISNLEEYYPLYGYTMEKYWKYK